MNSYLHTGPPVYFVVKEGYNYEKLDNQNKVCRIFYHISFVIPTIPYIYCIASMTTNFIGQTDGLCIS